MRELAEAALKRYGLEGTVVGSTARAWRSTSCCSSTRSRTATSPIICGKHVTTEAGTGLVHTAPAHGVDDYNIGKPVRPAGE